MNLTLEELIQETELLTKVLLYHVVQNGENNYISSLVDEKVLPTSIDENVYITVTKNETSGEVELIEINKSKIIDPDLLATNGVAQAIDAVLEPPSLNVIFENINSIGEFETLTTAVVAADLKDTLSNKNATLTLFAPINQAFANLTMDELNRLLDPIWVEHLQDLLLYHVLGSVENSTRLLDKVDDQVTTLNGENITVIQEEGKFFIRDVSGNQGAQILLP